VGLDVDLRRFLDLGAREAAFVFDLFPGRRVGLGLELFEPGGVLRDEVDVENVLLFLGPRA
jgi:hypothetical protein